MMKIYVASSWKTDIREVVRQLRTDGHTVYDFQNGPATFSWSEIDENWKNWTVDEFLKQLDHPLSERGFAHDMAALASCEACIMVMPCGLSAGLELGWAAGAGKRTAVYIPAMRDPDLMIKMTHFITNDMNRLIRWANR
jgi:hypothetical protein